MIDILFGSGSLSFKILSLIQQIIIVVIALTFHEVAHGWSAKKLGDDTAEKFGRLSLNPLKHLDPRGFLLMLLVGFGWANPVPIRAGRFKNPRRGMALSALAGPVMNIILAVVGMLFAEGIAYLGQARGLLSEEGFAFNLICVAVNFFFTFAVINVSLAVFNFLPIPPLDGSRVLYAVLPDKLYFGVMKYEQTIAIVLMVLLLVGALDTPLSFLVYNILRGIDFIIPIVPMDFVNFLTYVVQYLGAA